MKTRRWILSGVMAAGTIFSIAGCGDAVGGGKRYPDFRYRLTVEVDTPEGLKTGSSVIEVKTRVSGKNEIPSPRTIYSRVRGEAVTIDLGKRGLLFALLRTEYDIDWAAGVLSSAAHSFGPKPDNNFDASMKRTLALQGRYDIPQYHDNGLTRVDAEKNGGKLPSYYPIMVRFGDLSDPKSVAQVDPYKLDENFGKGVKLKRITVERTEDDVTTGIEKRLGWLKTHRGSLVKYPRNTPIGVMPKIHRLTEGDFIRRY